MSSVNPHSLPVRHQCHRFMIKAWKEISVHSRTVIWHFTNVVLALRSFQIFLSVLLCALRVAHIPLLIVLLDLIEYLLARVRYGHINLEDRLVPPSLLSGRVLLADKRVRVRYQGKLALIVPSITREL
jgi:hypothetical protein